MNRTNLSRNRVEERGMVNWVKANRTKMNAGHVKGERVGKFKELLEVGEKYKQAN